MEVVVPEIVQEGWKGFIQKRPRSTCLEVGQGKVPLGTVKRTEHAQKKGSCGKVFLWKFDFRSLEFHPMGFHRKVHTCSIGPYISHTSCKDHY